MAPVVAVLGVLLVAVLLTWCLLARPMPMTRGVFWTYVAGDMACFALAAWGALILVGVLPE